jgi:hypothetical protein
MTRRVPNTICLILIACCTILWLSAGCGDSLSSLDSVQRSSRRSFNMELNPDFGRRGKTVKVEVTSMDPELEQILAGGVAYPTEISFGRGVFIRSFGTNESDRLEIEVFISPLAEKGERTPTLVFAASNEQLEARGSFWVLPAQPE